MADLARRATRWVGTLSDGNVHVKFHDDRLRNGGDITYWNFMETRFGDLRPWPLILKIFVSHRVPILNVYVKFHDDRLRNDWDITLWNFAKTRTNTHTNKQTDMGITIPRPPRENTDKHTHKQTNGHGHYNTSPSPYGGRGNDHICLFPAKIIIECWDDFHKATRWPETSRQQVQKSTPQFFFIYWI